MLRFARAKEPTLVGLAMHQDRISMVKLKHKNILEAFAIADLPQGWLVDGKINHVEEVVQLIRNLIIDFQAENCCAAIGLPVSLVISKRIKVAACLSDAERVADIKDNLPHYFPGIKEPLSFDFIPLEENHEDDEVLLVAARSGQVDAYVSVAEQAGLKVRVVDVDIYALSRAQASCDIKLSSQINAQEFYLREPELLVALGLVLREFPRW